MIDFTNMGDAVCAFVISGELETRDWRGNNDATDALRRTLAEHMGDEILGFLPCRGVYKGTGEDSFLAFAFRSKGLKFAYQLREQFSQESVLLIDSYGKGHLHFANGPLSIGHVRWMPREEARGRDAYTIVQGFADAFLFEK